MIRREILIMKKPAMTVLLSAAAFAVLGMMPDLWPGGPAAAAAQSRGKNGVDGVFSPVLPAGAQELSSAVKAAKPGDTIIIHGRVPASGDPFGKNRAILTLIDEAAYAASLSGGSIPPPRDAGVLATV